MNFSSFIVLFLLISNLILVNCEIYRLRLCGDPKCKDPISEGVTLIKYSRGEEGILSFQKNTKVIIYGKSVDVQESEEELWEGEIDGNRGFLPRRFIKETRVLRSQLDYKVPLESQHDSNKKSETEKADEVKPDRTSYLSDVMSDSRTTPTETESTSETDTMSNEISMMDVSKEIASDSSMSSEVKQTVVAISSSLEVNASYVDGEIGVNSAVWFPERDVSDGTRSSGSFFPAFGVSADSSIDVKEPTRDDAEKEPVKEEVTMDGVQYSVIDGSTFFADDFVTDSLTLLSSQTEQSSENYVATPTLVQTSSDSPISITPSSVVIESTKPVASFKTTGSLLGEIYELVKGGVKEFIKQNQFQENSRMKSNRKLLEVRSEDAADVESDVGVETETEKHVESKDSAEEKLESDVLLELKSDSDAKIEPKVILDEISESNDISDEKIQPKDGSTEKTEAKELLNDEVEPKVFLDKKMEPKGPNQFENKIDEKDLSNEKMEVKSISVEQSNDTSNVTVDSKSDTVEPGNRSEEKIEPTAVPEPAKIETEPKSELTEESKIPLNSNSDTAKDEDDEDVDNDDAEDDDDDDDGDDPDDGEDDEEEETTNEIIESSLVDSIKDSITELPGEKSYFKDAVTDRPVPEPSNDKDEVMLISKDDDNEDAVTPSRVEITTKERDNVDTIDVHTSNMVDISNDSKGVNDDIKEEVVNLTFKAVAEESAENNDAKTNLTSLDAVNEHVDSKKHPDNSSVETDLSNEKDNEYKKELQEKVLTSTVSMFHHDWTDSIEEPTTEGSLLPLAEQLGGSCDAERGFDGSCPNPVAEKEKDKANIDTFVDDNEVEPSVEESVDYLQLALVYLWFLRDTVQFIVDCLPEPLHTFLLDLESAAVSSRVVVFTTIVGVFILLLQISVVAIKKRRKEKELIRKLCSLDQIHFVITKERDELKEKLDSFNHNITSWKSDYAGAQDALTSLQLDLEASKNECKTLQVQVGSLEEQLEMSTDAGLELNSMLSEFLTSQRDGGKLQEAVERLQGQLESQRGQLADLQLSYETTDLENQTLRTELGEYAEKNEQLATQLAQTNVELKNVELANEELKSGITERDECIEKLQITSDQLLKEAEVWDESVKVLQGQLENRESELKVATESLDLKCRELESVRESVEKLHTLGKAGESDGTEDADEVWQSLLEVSSLKSELQIVTRERDVLSLQLQEEVEARKDADDLSKRAVDDSEVLRKEYETAHREREEAMKKLEILSTYFKEKEMQLQKELGVQEAKRQESQENVTSVNVKMNLFEQEVELYKSQISSLKTEILSLERSYKNQIASHEKKAHENWLAARGAERKLEESKQEAATLRNKLTLLEQEKSNSQLNQSEAAQKYVRSNGEAPSPPRLGPNDRYDSMDLPTSSRSSLFRESIDFPNGVGVPFLPVDRPLPPPFLRGLPPPPLLPPPLLPPFDDRGPLPPPPFDPRRGPPDPWMPLPPRRRPMSPSSYSRGDRPSPPSSNASQRNHLASPPPLAYDRRQSSSRHTTSPPSDVDVGYGRPLPPPPPNHDDRGNHPRPYDNPPQMAWRGHPPPPGARPLPPHMRRDVYPPGQSDGRIDPRTSSPITRTQTDERDTAGV